MRRQQPAKSDPAPEPARRPWLRVLPPALAPDEAADGPAPVIRGLLIGLPCSALLWLGLVLLVRWIMGW